MSGGYFFSVNEKLTSTNSPVSIFLDSLEIIRMILMTVMDPPFYSGCRYYKRGLPKVLDQMGYRIPFSSVTWD